MNVKELMLGCFCCMLSIAAIAQNNHTAPAKVGIFIPLNLDTVFTSGGSYKYNNNIPRYVLPGLEFYSGVQIALDSLQKEGLNAEIYIIDTKDKNVSLSRHLSSELKDASLLIGMVQNVAELKTIADAAHARNIPFISATYPNDAATVGNPSLIILNSTLKSHCEAIYKLLANSYNKENIIVLTKPGFQEDKIKAILEESNSAASRSLKWKTADISNGIDTYALTALMDSTKNNVVVCATLDEPAGLTLIKQLSSLNSDGYRSTIIGMPTWDDISFTKDDYKGVEIVYSTPFLTASGNNRVFNSVTNKFKARSKSRPSDMVYKGFEITYRYIKNMLSHQDNIIDLSDRSGKIFSDFDIEPLKMRTTKNEPDYYENKKIYFIKKLDGIMKGIY